MHSLETKQGPLLKLYPEFLSQRNNFFYYCFILFFIQLTTHSCAVNLYSENSQVVSSALLFQSNLWSTGCNDIGVLLPSLIGPQSTHRLFEHLLACVDLLYPIHSLVPENGSSSLALMRNQQKKRAGSKGSFVLSAEHHRLLSQYFLL